MKPNEVNAQNSSKVGNRKTNSSQLPYDQFHMTQATTRILENLGFTAATQSCIYSLSSMMKNYFEELCRNSRVCANHAGREGVLFEDVNVAFKKVGVNITELHDYIREVDSFTTDIKIPLFPLAKSPLHSAAFVDITVEKQINEIDQTNLALPEAAPSKESKSLEETREETQKDAESIDRPTSITKREVRPQRVFPSFFGFTAKDLGFLVKNSPQKQVLASREAKNQVLEQKPSTSSPVKIEQESAPKPVTSPELKDDPTKAKSPTRLEINALQAIYANYSKKEETEESKSKKKKKKKDKDKDKDDSRRHKKKEKRDKKPEVPIEPLQQQAAQSGFVSTPNERREAALAPDNPVELKQPVDVSEELVKQHLTISETHEPQPDELVVEKTEVELAPESSNKLLKEEEEQKADQNEVTCEDQKNQPTSPPLPILPELSAEVGCAAPVISQNTVEDSHHKKKKSKKDKRDRENKDIDKDSRKEKKAKKRSRQDEDENGRKESKKAKLEDVVEPEEHKVPKITIKFGLNKTPLTPRVSAQPTSENTGTNLVRSSPPTPPVTKANSSIVGPNLPSSTSINIHAPVDQGQQQACNSSAPVALSTSQPPALRRNEEETLIQQSSPNNSPMACATASMPIFKALKIAKKDIVDQEDKPKEKKKPGPKKKVREEAAFSPKRKTTAAKRSETPNEASSSSFNLSQEVKRSESAMERPHHQTSRSHTPPPVVLLTDEKKVVKKQEVKKPERPRAKQAGVPPSLPVHRLKTGVEKKTAPKFEDIFGKDVKKPKLEESKKDKSILRPTSSLSVVNADVCKPSTEASKSDLIQLTPKQGTGRKQSKPKKLSPENIAEEPSTTVKSTVIAKKKKRLDTEINRIFNAGSKNESPANKTAAKQPATVVAAPKKVLVTAEEEEIDNVWICPVCSVAYVDGASDMVGCDGCNEWFHWHCVGLLIAPPENKQWYCPSCSKKRKKLGETTTSKKKCSTTTTKPQRKKK